MARFLVAGFIQIETIVKVDTLPVPYHPFSSVPDLIHTDMGGAGYNEALALSWLGNQVDFMSMIGKDMNVEQFARYTDMRDVRLDFTYVLPRLEAMPTAVIMYASDGTTQVFEDVKDIRTVEYDASLYESQIQDKDMVVVSDCNFCRPLLELAQRYHKPLAVNVRTMHGDRASKKTDFLQAADIVYVRDNDVDGDPYQCIEECRRLYNPEIIIISIGTRGVILYDRSDSSVLEYKSVKTCEVVNTVGMGNAMLSAFLHYYVKTGNAKEAIKNALMFAACKVGFVGTSRGFMNEEQIEQWKNIIWR